MAIAAAAALAAISRERMFAKPELREKLVRCVPFNLFQRERLLFVGLVAFLTVTTGARAELIAPTTFQLIKAPLKKTPNKSHEGFSVGSNTPLPEVFYRNSFPKWKRYSDERVEFDYPDDPALTLELIDPKSKKTIPIAGSPVRTVSYRPQMIYRIQSEGKTWAILIRSDDQWLDDGVCLCGAVVLRSYLMHEGAFYAFSFLENGEIKQVQCLGENSRLILFESTHLPMAQSDYVRIGQSLAVKKPIERTEADLRSETVRRYAFYGRLGWLWPQMPIKEIESLLGVPASRRADVLIYEMANDEWKTTWRLPINGGILQPLPNDFVSDSKVLPRSGTLRWFSERLKKLKNVDDDMPRKVPHGGWQKDCFNTFMREAPMSSANSWDDWCQIAHNLYEKGFADPRIIPIVKARFLEPIRQHYARWILDDYDNAGSQELFKKRLELTIEAANRILEQTKSDDVSRPDPSGQFGVWDDTHNLLAGIPRAERNLLLPKLLDNPHPEVRGDAFYYLDVMPEPQRTAFARRGLDDQVSQVRAWAANAIGEGAGSKEDLPKLRQLLANDKDYYVQIHVKEAIARLEKLP